MGRSLAISPLGRGGPKISRQSEFDSYNGANPKLLSAGKTLTMKRAIQAAGYSSKVRSINQNGRSGRASKS